MKKDTLPAPLKLVKHWKQTMPGVYDQLNVLQRLEKQGKIEWSGYYELPIGAAAEEFTVCWG